MNSRLGDRGDSPSDLESPVNEANLDGYVGVIEVDEAMLTDAVVVTAAAAAVTATTSTACHQKQFGLRQFDHFAGNEFLHDKSPFDLSCAASG
jgi:hypothetical protein